MQCQYGYFTGPDQVSLVSNRIYETCLKFMIPNHNPGDYDKTPTKANESEQPSKHHQPDVSLKSHVCGIVSVKLLLQMAGVWSPRLVE